MALGKSLNDSNEIVDSLCRGCDGCRVDFKVRSEQAGKLEMFLGSVRETRDVDLALLDDRISLLLELVRAFSELIGRSAGLKFKGFSHLEAEISSAEREYEKQRTRPDAEGVTQEALDALINNISELKSEHQKHETFDKFVQYCLGDELAWVHAHKPAINHLLQELFRHQQLVSQQFLNTMQ